MLDDAFQAETDAALADMVQRPSKPKPIAVSGWAQTAEFISAPFKGVGQAGLQTMRVANTAAPTAVGNPLAMTAAEQDELLQEAGITRENQDQALRRTIQGLRPDPITSTMASQFLQEGSRMVSKALFYGATGGPAAAIVGTGLDEGVTGAQEMRDAGVDPATAAKVGAVRGVTMGASVALPVVGQTALRTAALVAVGGPGTFIAEQSITREILNRANYPELSRQYDPFDLVGLGLSVAVPGVVGAVMHRARVKAVASGKSDPQAEIVHAMAKDVESVDAALVAHRSETIDAQMLAPGRLEVAESHVRALDDASAALDQGAPVRITDAVIDPDVASRVLTEMDAKLKAARAEIQTDAPEITLAPATRSVATAERLVAPMQPDTPAITESTIVDRVREAVGVLVRGQQERPATPAAEPLQQRQASPEVRHAQELAQRMSDMPVRLDDDGSMPQRASDLMDQVRKESQRESAEARKAFEAAVQCFLEVGA